jgi:hypothetical protein
VFKLKLENALIAFNSTWDESRDGAAQRQPHLVGGVLVQDLAQVLQVVGVRPDECSTESLSPRRNRNAACDNDTRYGDHHPTTATQFEGGRWAVYGTVSGYYCGMAKTAPAETRSSRDSDTMVDETRRHVLFPVDTYLLMTNGRMVRHLCSGVTSNMFLAR